jgi:cyclic nucleotide gated channel, plant
MTWKKKDGIPCFADVWWTDYCTVQYAILVLTFFGNSDATSIPRFYDERTKLTIPVHEKQAELAANRLGLGSSGKNKIFVSGHGLWFNKIIDPSSDFILKWTYVFRITCYSALFVDPLYFYVPEITYGQTTSCVRKDMRLAIIVTVFRSIIDLFYAIQIIIKFRTAYINHRSKLGVFGRGHLVTDPKEIAKQYLRSDFTVDLVASLPLPQVIWLLLHWTL